MRALDDEVRAGRVLYVGISDAPAWVVARANTLAEWPGWSPFVGLQIPYSLRHRDAERELLPMAAELGVTPAQVATAWPRAHAPFVHPIVGPRTLEQLDDSLGVAGLELPDDVLEGR